MQASIGGYVYFFHYIKWCYTNLGPSSLKSCLSEKERTQISLALWWGYIPIKSLPVENKISQKLKFYLHHNSASPTFNTLWTFTSANSWAKSFTQSLLYNGVEYLMRCINYCTVHERRNDCMYTDQLWAYWLWSFCWLGAEGTLPLPCSWKIITLHITSPAKDQNAKLEIWFLKCAYCFWITVNLKKPHQHKSGTICTYSPLY